MRFLPEFSQPLGADILWPSPGPSKGVGTLLKRRSPPTDLWPSVSGKRCSRTPDYTCECLFAIRTKIGLEAQKCLFQVRTNGRQARQMLHQVAGHWRPSDHIPV